MAAAGRVVLLNGTASSGKSTLAMAFQALAPTMWVRMAQDDFAQNLSARWVDIVDVAQPERSDGFSFVRGRDGTMSVAVGTIGDRLLRGYRSAVGAVARAGVDVVVDEAMFDDGALMQWQRALEGLTVLWVRVECDLAVCEARERARADRQLITGLARGLYDRVHREVPYDLVVSTTATTSEECARTILAAVPRKRSTAPSCGYSGDP